jgi:acetyltransferase-like isoleucine patch superfamily enzyme
VDQNIFQQYKYAKGAAPGWTKRLPKGMRSWLVRLYWLRNDSRDFCAELIGRLPVHYLRLFLYRRLGIRIGKKTSIHRGCRFYAPSNVRIADHTIINRDVLLDGRSSLEIGKNVSISEGALILTLEHDPYSPDFTTRGAKVVIEDYVFVGARALILPGVTIGRGAVVAAGAVVTQAIPEYQIVGGVPARPIGQRSPDLRYSLDYQKFLG